MNRFFRFFLFLWFFLNICFWGTLTGCAHAPLKAPCANYGQYCSKTPINHWDNR